MDSRERFNRTLSFQSVDHPFSLDVGIWGQTLDRWPEEGMPRDVHRGPISLFLDGNEYFGFERVRWLDIDVNRMIPALWVLATVLFFNFLGDGLRDAADPHGA